jgi:hypothetical protein
MRKIVLWKRDDGDERERSIAKIAAADFAAQTKRRRFEKIVDGTDEDEARRRHAQILGATGGSRDETQRERAGEGDDEIEINGTGAAAGHHVSQLADLLTEAADGELTRAEILRWLLHHRDGRSLARAFKRQEAERPPVEVRKNMSATENLVAIAKARGTAAIFKLMVDKNDAMGITEHDFVAVANVDAERFRRPGETREQSFARMLTTDQTMQKAYTLAKIATLDVQPVFVGGTDATDVNNDKSKTYQQLVDKAEELRRRSTTPLSESQAFARVFEAPENRELAAKAHQRPSPTTNYAFPR